MYLSRHLCLVGGYLTQYAQGQNNIREINMMESILQETVEVAYVII